MPYRYSSAGFDNLSSQTSNGRFYRMPARTQSRPGGNDLHSNQKGFYAITIAISAAAILLVVALGIDAAQVYRARTRLQNALDLGALKATYMMRDNLKERTQSDDAIAAQAERLISAALELNGDGNQLVDNILVDVRSPYGTVKATGIVHEKTILMGALSSGFSSMTGMTVSAKANAEYAPDRPAGIGFVIDMSRSMRDNTNCSTPPCPELHDAIGTALKELMDDPIFIKPRFWAGMTFFANSFSFPAIELTPVVGGQTDFWPFGTVMKYNVDSVFPDYFSINYPEGSAIWSALQYMRELFEAALNAPPPPPELPPVPPNLDMRIILISDVSARSPYSYLEWFGWDSFSNNYDDYFASCTDLATTPLEKQQRQKDQLMTVSMADSGRDFGIRYHVLGLGKTAVELGYPVDPADPFEWLYPETFIDDALPPMQQNRYLANSDAHITHLASRIAGIPHLDADGNPDGLNYPCVPPVESNPDNRRGTYIRVPNTDNLVEKLKTMVKEVMPVYHVRLVESPE